MYESSILATALVEEKEPDHAGVMLPVGWRNAKCPNCGSSDLAGALITETADHLDPNILCLTCDWFD